MKKRIPIFMMSLLMYSCNTYTYVQIHEVKTSDNIKNNEESLIYEDDYCIISYNLWRKGGDPSFEFKNKTEKTIYINLSECFFIMNETAYDYYLKRTYSSSNGSSIYLPYRELYNLSGSNEHITINGPKTQMQTIEEKETIAIPGKTKKKVCEYGISNIAYKDCNLNAAPSKKRPSIKEFNKDNSPIRFENRINYSIDGKSVTIVNKFYVYKITNYNSEDIRKLVVEKNCDNINTKSYWDFKKTSPNEYYLIIN